MPLLVDVCFGAYNTKERQTDEVDAIDFTLRLIIAHVPFREHMVGVLVKIEPPLKYECPGKIACERQVLIVALLERDTLFETCTSTSIHLCLSEV